MLSDVLARVMWDGFWVLVLLRGVVPGNFGMLNYLISDLCVSPCFVFVLLFPPSDFAIEFIRWSVL